MGYLVVAALFIVIGSFCLVYGLLDKKCSVKMRRILLVVAAVCFLLVCGLTVAIMKNPLR